MNPATLAAWEGERPGAQALSPLAPVTSELPAGGVRLGGVMPPGEAALQGGEAALSVADVDPALAALCHAFHAVRQHTLALVAPLSAEDCGAQSMPEASPAKWHLAHTTWFFETFVLQRWERNHVPYHPGFGLLFNSYYDSVGARHPRPARGLLTRPSLAEVQAYRQQVDLRLSQLLEGVQAGAPGLAGRTALQAMVALGLQHEQQHQELLLTDAKHLLFANPLRPAYSAGEAPLALANSGLGTGQALVSPQPVRPMGFLKFSGGLADIGHAGDGFAFDNESPRHRVYLQPYAIADRLVSNGEFRAFVEQGGYDDPLLWLSEGWQWRQATAQRHPLYWQPGAPTGWQEFTLGGLRPLRDAEPVAHLCYYEADAFARWAGARLPTEAEWENAAAALAPSLPAGGSGRPAEAGTDGRPHAAGACLHPAVAGVDDGQWWGQLWQWTQSAYAAYPGFRAAPGAVGEYNGKFMVNQYVLRGSSCATPVGHARLSYRNFFPAHACWQFTGLRLARDG